MKNSKNNSVPTEKTLGRRELLKALAATGSAVVASSMLPNQWTKPVIEAGVLPAHAQGSKRDQILEVVQNETDYEIRLKKGNDVIAGPVGPKVVISIKNPSKGSYVVEAKYTGSQPPPKPDPRPSGEIKFDGKQVDDIAPSSFLNNGKFNSVETFSIT